MPAVSESQRRLFALVREVQRGKAKAPSQKITRMASKMKPSVVEEFTVMKREPADKEVVAAFIKLAWEYNRGQQEKAAVVPFLMAGARVLPALFRGARALPGLLRAAPAVARAFAGRTVARNLPTLARASAAASKRLGPVATGMGLGPGGLARQALQGYAVGGATELAMQRLGYAPNSFSDANRKGWSGAMANPMLRMFGLGPASAALLQSIGQVSAGTNRYRGTVEGYTQGVKDQRSRDGIPRIPPNPGLRHYQQFAPQRPARTMDTGEY